MKPIEERVKNIVENNAFLNIKEKSEIICLIKCYESADSLVQKYWKENQKMKDIIKQIINTIEGEPELYYLVEILESSIKEEN